MDNLQLFLTLFFLFFTLISLIGLLLANKLMIGAFLFLFVLLGISGLYITAGADFLGATQIMIYVGGVLLLIVFGVMLTHKYQDESIPSKKYEFYGLILMALLVLTVFIWKLLKSYDQSDMILQQSKFKEIQTIGYLLITYFAIPFEVSGILLLMALIGATSIVKKDFI